MPCPPRLPPARKMSETSCRSSSFSQTPPPWPSPGRGRDPSAKIHYPAITAQRHGLSTGLLEHTRTAVSVKARLTSAAAEGQSTGASFCVPALFPANSLENKILSRRVKSGYTRSTRSEYVRERPPDPLWCIRSRPAYGRAAQAGSEDQTPGPPFPNPPATARVARLYEQNAPLEEIRRGVEQYVRRWKRWVSSGVREVSKALEWPGGSRGPAASRRTSVLRPVSSSP